MGSSTAAKIFHQRRRSRAVWGWCFARTAADKGRNGVDLFSSSDTDTPGFPCAAGLWHTFAVCTFTPPSSPSRDMARSARQHPRRGETADFAIANDRPLEGKRIPICGRLPRAWQSRPHEIGAGIRPPQRKPPSGHPLSSRQAIQWDAGGTNENRHQAGAFGSRLRQPRRAQRGEDFRKEAAMAKNCCKRKRRAGWSTA